jgi:arylsulfatase A-like enzyme
MSMAPNIVIIMADQHRADMLGCAGNNVLTPNLDALASNGTRFSRVSCQGPLCMPARASFMTERYVRDHGVYTNSAEIDANSPTYVWALREAGYHTALVGKAHLYLDEILQASHVDQLAPRLHALGFLDVQESCDKFAGDRPNRYTDHLARRGLLDA